MGTEVHYKNSFQEYYSMRDVNDDSNNSSWSIFYGDKASSNGHYSNGFLPRTVTDAYPGHDKDALKQKMLEHEAIFKNQVYELHRLYRRQRDMMEEVKRKEFSKYPISIDTSSSSSLLPSQKPYEEAHQWQIPSFPLPKSSIFGAEISNSPLSCSKGINLKDCELAESSRPSKVRKKLFDLQRPADEYIDPEEREEIEENPCEITSYPPKEMNKLPNGVKTFFDNGGKKDFRRFNGLADLNEPVHIEEAIAPPSVDFFGQPSVSRFLGQPREIFDKPQNGIQNGAFNRLPVEGNCNGRDWLSYMREAGNTRSSMNFTSQEHQRPGTYSEFSCKVQNFNQTPLSFVNSHIYPFVNSSDSRSWGKPNDSLTHKLTSFPAHPSLLSVPQSHEVFGHMNGSYMRNTGSGNDPATKNGYFRGSSSGSKDLSARLTSVDFNSRNCNNLDDGSRKIFKGSNFIDLTGPAKGVDLNTVQTLFNDNDDDSRKCHQTALPWLRAKVDSSKNGDSLVNNKKILGFPIFGNSCVSKNDSSSLVSTSASLRCPRENEKMKNEIERRGIDINVAWDDTDVENGSFKNHFDLNFCVTEDEDLLACEPLKSLSEKVKKIAMEIDLEAPAVEEMDDEEDEEAIQCGDDHKKFDALSRSPEKMADQPELVRAAAEVIVAISGQQDHVGPTSAEVAVCSDDDDDRLLWFSEVIAKNVRSTPNELDEYEMLTLRLEETKEEDYMPKPFVHDFREPESETGPTSLPGRPRRGQARRGRPRRDFQKDILPGMVSLSRHEVTEDLQIFGGLMKATGHSWNLGLTRRKGSRKGARGRQKVAAAAAEPPPAATLPPIEVVGLEERSLTGWGKTTRRPRRQRCAAGTSVAVPLT